MSNEIKPVWINRGDPYWSSLNIKKIEKHYNASYVGDFCLDRHFGQTGKSPYWTDYPYAVFYTETPAKPEYSNYFGMCLRWLPHETSSVVIITNAISAATGYWDGMVADNGEIVYSRYRHEFHSSKDGSVAVDGGRDYIKVMGHITNPRVRLSIVRDKIVVNDVLYLPCKKPRKARKKVVS
jgi:hypothetical protein